MKVYLSAGEESGDLHGAHLVRELKSRLPEAAFAGMGGARMRDEGFATLVSAEGHNVVGFFEVFGRLAQFRRDLNALARAMVADGARALVAIDYGGFNARLVARAKRAGLKTFYYIPPKLWAWGKGRGARLARDVDLVLAVFPFEEEYWRRAGARVAFVGHPLLDITRPSGDARKALGLSAGEEFLLVLPGSRRQELAALWPPLAAALPAIMKARPGLRVVVAPGPNLGTEDLTKHAAIPEGVVLTREPAVNLMPAAAAAVAASGTATLELAILGTPMVILYKAATFTWELGRRLVYVSHLGLPNVLAGRPIVPELLQGNVKPSLIAYETLRVLNDDALRRRMAADYAAIRAGLAPPAADGATAPARAARLIAEALA